MIRKRTSYIYRGSEFQHPADIAQHIENQLGRQIDEVDHRAAFSMGCRVKLELIELFTDKARAKNLIALLEEYQEAAHYVDENDD